MASEDKEGLKEKLSGLLYGIDTLGISVSSRIETLDLSIQDMRKYMSRKEVLGDWHAVMDAAADIREMVAEKNALRNIKTSLDKLL